MILNDYLFRTKLAACCRTGPESKAIFVGIPGWIPLDNVLDKLKAH